jgi:hypothetical protein
MILADTSIWIEFFRSRDSAVARELDRLLEEGVAATCGLVLAELLPGLRKKQRVAVRGLMESLPNLEIPADIWDDVAEMQEKALDKGSGPFSLPDLIIAAAALRHDAELFTRDRHFNAISALTGLRLHAC